MLKLPKIVIPEEVASDYAGAFSEMASGENTLVGYQDKIRDIQAYMSDIEAPTVLLVAEQGMGKTALVEQIIYNSHHVSDEELERGIKPLLVVRLDIETLGTLGTNIMVARLRNIFTAMRKVQQATEQANPDATPFQLVMFMDEIHKLQAYGSTKGSSQAMNALKEGSARGEFPIIGATTTYEFQNFIRPDLAFVRRFHNVTLTEPDLELTKQIVTRRADRILEKINHVVEKPSEEFIDELLYLTNSYIKSQVNPAKSISTLSSAIGYAKAFKKPLNHETLSAVFGSMGYNIDVDVDTEYAEKYLKERIIGQPLAIEMVLNVLRVSHELSASRDRSKPFATMWFGGTTGVGKSEMCKLLAYLLYGRKDALVTVNGGDYPEKKDAIVAQHFIGDAMVASKQRIILLDEIEKSDPAVQMSYMRMIDEGIVLDSDGIEQSLNNTMIIATSNLASERFKILKESMRLEEMKDENNLTSDHIKQWHKEENSVRQSMTTGDLGRDDGVRPEFLERFQSLVPFFPFSKPVLAKIGHMMLTNEFNILKRDGITIQTPEEQPKTYWAERLRSPEIKYDNVNKIDVFIAEDVMNQDAKTAGARSIRRFVNESIRPKIAKAKRYCISNGIDYTNGVFMIDTNGKSSLDTDLRDYSDVEFRFIKNYS